jgi:hypothetical protein
MPAGFLETHFGLASVTPGGADDDYIEKLRQAKIIDNEFIEDVLTVDLTRAVFSDDRCGLLEFVPQLDAATLNADDLRAGMIANLRGAAPGTPQDELLRNLSNPSDDARKVVETFEAACTARGNVKQVVQFEKDGKAEEITVGASLVDYMSIISLNRALARSVQVFEFPETMPSDALNVPKGTRLHPVTCELTREFVAIAEEPTARPDCVHGVCDADATEPLANNCIPVTPGVPDDCVAQICAADGACCTTSWDDKCQAAVSSLCGFECPAEVECCRVCSSGKPCGNGCIAKTSTCSQPSGCACDVNGNPSP